MTPADDSTIASSVDGLSLDDKGNKFAKHADKCSSEENCGCNNHSDEGEEKGDEKEREDKPKEGDSDNSGVLHSKGGGDEEMVAKRSRGDGGGQKRVSGIENKALQNIDDCTKGLMMSQMRDLTVSIEGSEGLMPMLRSCLESNLERFSVVVISGAIEHFESTEGVDLGWGCGWRNIQMLCSYLLSEDAEVREVLFGSAGFVPDISALQAWLEIAWAKGFDVAGGEYFNWKIWRTNKWIGTTEGAALLRSFGVRAQIVDFQATGGKRGSGDMRTKTGQQKNSKTPVESDNGDEDGDDNDDESQLRNNNSSEDEGDDENEADGETLNPDSEPPSSGGEHRREPSEVECAVCGEHQLNDSQIRRDLRHSGGICPTCSQNSSQTCQNSIPKPGKQDENPSDIGHDISGHERGEWDKKTGGGGSEEGSMTMKHTQMVDWIWSYFTLEILNPDGQGPDSSIILSQRSPLYFQHRGHSQTIVGVERRRKTSPPPEQHFDGDDDDDVYLLVLDPSQPTMRILQSLKEKQGWEKLLKRGLRTLKQTEYQLCYVDRGVAKGEEYVNLKLLTSHSYTY